MLGQTKDGQKETEKAAVGKMSGRQALIAVIVLILAFFGTIGAWNYFNFSIEAKRIEAEEKSRQINEEDHKALYELLEKLNDQTKDGQKETEKLK